MSYLDLANQACLKIQGLNIQSNNIKTGEIEGSQLDEMGTFLIMQFGTTFGNLISQYGEKEGLDNLITPALLGLKFSWGNCECKAALAMLFLGNRGVRPIDMMSVGDDHVLLVLGRSKGSNILDVTTWGSDAVICDPWADAAYPAAQLATKSKEAPLKAVIGDELKTSQMYELNAWPPKGLSQVLSDNASLFNRVFT